MKKLISIALALTICAGFSSCGGDEPETSVSSKAESINVSSSSSSKISSSSKVSSSSNSYSSKSESKSYYSESDSDDSFYCMGKNDTCSNKQAVHMTFIVIHVTLMTTILKATRVKATAM